jgi:hypothetical protein
MRNRLVSAAAALVLARWSAPGQVPTLTTWTVPGVVKAAGLNGTNFVSDLVITNPGSSLAIVTFAFVPALAGAPTPQFLAPGQSVTLKDAVASVFGAAQAAGAILVSSTAPLIIRGRTYNTASAGTFGVSLPVISDDRFLQPGDSADSLWVTQSSDGSKGYRTNIAVVFPDGGGGDATVTLYDQSGTAMGQQAFSQTSAGLQQVSVGGFATGALPVGRASIQVTRGRAAGYAVVVDNVTGDGSLYSFEDLPAGPQDVIVNGVTRAGGQLGTFWRTDGRLFNPDGSSDAAVTLSWLPAGNGNASPQTASVTVPAGRILDLPDILSAVFGLPSGSSGALRVQSDRAVAVLCRTSNLDPTGQKPGTFGAQQRAVPLASFLMSGDAGGIVTGVRQSAAFRTNVGFAAGPDGAAYALTLKSPSGGTIASTSASLGAFGWTQPNVGSLFPGSIPDDSQLVVQVTSGSLDVYDSFIDNGSGDPVVTEIAALPAALPASATIGMAGGSIRSDDGRLTLKFPAGALTAATPISITTTTSNAPNGVGPGYQVNADPAALTGTTLAVFSFSPSDVEGGSPEGLAIALSEPDAWYTVGGGSVDVFRRTLTVVLPSGPPQANSRTSLNWPFPPTTHQGLMAILNAWKISPPTAGLLTNQSLQLLAYYSGPPSTEPCSGYLCLQKTTDPQFVSVVWYLDGAGTLSPAPSVGQTTTYQAPCQAPTVPVAVSFEVSDPRFPREFGKQTAHVNVYARHWTIDYQDIYSDQFTLASNVISFSYGASGGKLGFSFTEGGSITNIHTLQDPVRIFSWVQVGGKGCSMTADSNSFNLMSLQDPQGAIDLHGSGYLHASSLYTETGSPSISITCPEGSGQRPAESGKTFALGPAKIGPGGLVSGSPSSTLFKIRPAGSDCGP